MSNSLTNCLNKSGEMNVHLLGKTTLRRLLLLFSMSSRTTHSRPSLFSLHRQPSGPLQSHVRSLAEASKLFDRSLVLLLSFEFLPWHHLAWTRQGYRMPRSIPQLSWKSHLTALFSSDLDSNMMTSLYYSIGMYMLYAVWATKPETFPRTLKRHQGRERRRVRCFKSFNPI